MTLRSVAVVVTGLFALVTISATQFDRTAQVSSSQVKAAVAMPGTKLAAMTDQQSGRLTGRVNELLTGSSVNGAGMAAFVGTIQATRRSGSAHTARVCPGKQTIEEVCRQMGKLMVRQQELETNGKKAQVAAFLNKVHAARESGMPEAQVQAMVSEGLKNGQLAVGADDECRQVQQQIDELTRSLVEGEQALAGPVLRTVKPTDVRYGVPGIIEGPIEVSSR